MSSTTCLKSPEASLFWQVLLNFIYIWLFCFKLRQCLFHFGFGMRWQKKKKNWALPGLSLLNKALVLTQEFKTSHGIERFQVNQHQLHHSHTHQTPAEDRGSLAFKSHCHKNTVWPENTWHTTVLHTYMNCCWNVLEGENLSWMHPQNHLLLHHLPHHSPGFPLNHTQLGLQMVVGKAVGVLWMWNLVKLNKNWKCR